MTSCTLKNGVQMPLLGFGTFQLSGDACKQAVCSAIREGYRLLDTAQAYGNEESVGEGIRLSGLPREHLFLVTKVNFTSYENAREAVLSSLEKLQTDYLDMILLHWSFGNVYAAWRELEKLYEEKKVRAIGVSNFDPDRLIDLIHFNRIAPMVNQIETNLYCQRISERPWLAKYGVQHMAYAPLGQGSRNAMFSEPVVLSLAEKYRKTPAQILLRFLTQQDIVVIPRSANPEHIRENAAVFDFELTDGELASLRALDENKPFIGRAEQPDFVEFAMTW